MTVEFNYADLKTSNFDHPIVQAESDKWIKFSFGFALGAIVEYTANYDGNSCLSSVATLLESSYLIYFYLSAY